MAALKATLDVQLHEATVRGVPAAVVQRALSATWHETTASDGQVRTIPRQATFCTSQGTDNFTLPAGLVRRLTMELRRQGTAVTTVDRNEWPLLAVAAANAVGLGFELGVLQSELLKQPRGQIVIHSMRQAADVISDAAVLYPVSSVLVVAKNNDDAGTLDACLQNVLSERLREPNNTETSDGDVVVINIAAAAQEGVLGYDLVFFLGSEVALQSAAKELFSSASSQHVLRYALLLPGRRLKQYEQLSLEALVGPVICQLYPSAGPPPTVQVSWLPSTRLCPSTTLQGWRSKQVSVWDNTCRNQHIADAADAISRQDADRLLDLGCETVLQHIARLDGPVRMALLVESQQHADSLARLLPDWTVCTAKSKAAELGSRSIVTEGYVIEHGLDAEIVLHATAGNSNLSLLTAGRKQSKRRRPAVQLLVDVADPFSQATQQRYQDYVRQGYQVDPVPAMRLGGKPITIHVESADDGNHSWTTRPPHTRRKARRATRLPVGRRDVGNPQEEQP